MKTSLRASLTLALALASSVLAAEIKIYPYDGARMLAGQRFDLRIEAEGVTGVQAASVTLNGEALSGFTPTNTKENSAEWTLRGQSLPAGNHTLEIRFQSAQGEQSRSVNWEVVAAAERAQAKNVILFVVDGMGWNTLQVANLVAHPYNPENGMPTGKLAMMTDPQGMASITTSSYDSVMADSANTASSIAGGQKILVNALNVFPDNTPDTLDNPRIEPITAMLRRTTGARIGIVTNTFGTDATPAAFVAFTRSRGDRAEIASQYIEGEVRPDVMLMGGSRDFIPQSAPGSNRRDDRNLIDEAERAGFQFVSTRTELMEMQPNEAGKLFGLFHIDNMSSYLDRAQYRRPEMLGDFTDQPYMWEMVQRAVETLEGGDEGFFLMVEGGMVDKFLHPLDWQRATWDLIELDRAVEWAKEYAAANPDTLIVITADHAHSISTYGGYDATQGPGQRDAVGVYAGAGFPTYGDRRDENGIPMVETARTYAVGFAAVPDHCETYLHRPVFQSPTISQGEGAERRFVANPRVCEEGGVQRTGNLPVRSSTGVHTADPLPLFAFGAGAEHFRGTMDQTEIFFVLSRVLGVDGHRNR